MLMTILCIEPLRSGASMLEISRLFRKRTVLHSWAGRWLPIIMATVFPTFVNVATLFILSGTFIKLLKDYKARYLGIGKVDEDMALFYEDKKAKEEK